MSGAIKICTAWKRTGALRIRPGWLGPVAEFEETRQTGRTFGPGHETLDGVEPRWRRTRNADLAAPLNAARGGMKETT